MAKLTAPTLSASTPLEIRSRGAANEIVRQMARNPGSVVGAAMLLALVVLALIGPVLIPHDPIKISQQLQLREPGGEHLMGADNLGRDVFARIASGARISMQVGIIAVGIAASIGIALGLPSGYFGSWVDLIVMRVIDVLLAFPSILLALCIVAVLGPNLGNVMIAVGIAAVPVYTRLVRASVLTVKAQPYVEAARVIGGNDLIIMVRHILPNVVAPVIVLGTLGVATAILTAAALSFLGLGAQPPSPEWGAMLSDGRNFLRVAWWLTVFPGLAIMLTVLAINLVGDGLRDALDPRLKVN